MLMKYFYTQTFDTPTFRKDDMFGYVKWMVMMSKIIIILVFKMWKNNVNHLHNTKTKTRFYISCLEQPYKLEYILIVEQYIFLLESVFHHPS